MLIKKNLGVLERTMIIMSLRFPFSISVKSLKSLYLEIFSCEGDFFKIAKKWFYGLNRTNRYLTALLLEKMFLKKCQWTKSNSFLIHFSLNENSFIFLSSISETF